MSSMSLAVSAGAVRPPPCLLMPLLFDSSPPTLTVVCTSSPITRIDVEHDQAVVEQQHVAGPHVARQLLVVEADASLLPSSAARRRARTRCPLEQHLAVLELADADLRALQVGHDRDLAADLARGFAHQLGALDVVLRRAVARS